MKISVIEYVKNISDSFVKKFPKSSCKYYVDYIGKMHILYIEPNDLINAKHVQDFLSKIELDFIEYYPNEFLCIGLEEEPTDRKLVYSCGNLSKIKYGYFKSFNADKFFHFNWTEWNYPNNAIQLDYLHFEPIFSLNHFINFDSSTIIRNYDQYLTFNELSFLNEPFCNYQIDQSIVTLNILNNFNPNDYGKIEEDSISKLEDFHLAA